MNILKPLLPILIICAFCLGMALTFLFIFTVVVLQGSAWIGEPNPYILWSEITMLIGIIIFSFIYAIQTIKKAKVMHGIRR